MSDIKLIKGMKIGHIQKGKGTGATVFLAPSETVGGVCVKGAAPGTRETDALKEGGAVPFVNAVVFSGGSAFGLEAASGVMQYLAKHGEGFKVGDVVVPIVAGAVIFDIKDKVIFPTKEDGFLACERAKKAGIKWGSVGVGAGATIGKILGADNASKGGIFAYTNTVQDIFVSSFTVINSLGDVFCESTGRVLAGAKMGGNFIDTERAILQGAASQAAKGANTTLSLVVTNASLTKLEANKLASVCHNGFARAIRPVHTDYDGDTIFVLSKGKKKVDFTMLSTMAIDAVKNSIIKAAL